MRWCVGSIARYFDRIPVRANDPIGIQEHREMLVVSEAGLEHGDRDFALGRNVLEQGKYLADGHFAGVLLCSIIRPVE